MPLNVVTQIKLYVSLQYTYIHPMTYVIIAYLNNLMTLVITVCLTSYVNTAYLNTPDDLQTCLLSRIMWYTHLGSVFITIPYGIYVFTDDLCYIVMVTVMCCMLGIFFYRIVYCLIGQLLSKQWEGTSVASLVAWLITDRYSLSSDLGVHMSEGCFIFEFCLITFGGRLTHLA